jgi:Flp pilus assembly protein TadG
LRSDPATPSDRRRSKRCGAAVVEFAVLAPILFLLIFGMIEYGRMVMVQQLITNAAREGARVAILDGMTNDDVEDAVQDKVGGAITILDTDVTTDPADITTAAAGAAITVTVGVNFSDVSWLPDALWLGGKRLTASSAMRRETVE